MEFMSPRRLVGRFAELVRREWNTFWLATVGTVLMSFAIVALTVPYRFAGAGLAGIAILTKYVWNISPAWAIAFGNVFLLGWGWRVLSPRFVLWTLYVSMLTSGAVAFFELFSYPMLQDEFLAAILAGVFGGVGIGLVFRVGASTGGTDVIVMAARKRWGVDVGMYSFYINIAILLGSWFVVDLEKLLLGGVALYVESLVIDSVLKSFDRRKQITVITSRDDEVRRFILEILGKSATMVKAEGAYTGDERMMFIVVVNRRQAMELKRFVVSVDPRAFIVLSDVAEVVGEGFKHWKHI
ncbi:YitT family protein [Dethiosulfovibrio sp. F2B]|uniref:YitT family protein n=1 Tax=Dethiosulfovibrio faecalis TaxID=2720018 RepID=UPI001F33DEC9|nr:YitT family protein [Dethiosulfovibrio faecalis]MCF4151728.1 YitT family protein [Dethiosulfovibrio faecalis]